MGEPLKQEVQSDLSFFSTGEATGKTLPQLSPGTIQWLVRLEFSQHTYAAKDPRWDEAVTQALSGEQGNKQAENKGTSKLREMLESG